MKRLSRRALLAGAATLVPAWKLYGAPASPSPAADPIAGLGTLASNEWRTLSALVDQVYPDATATGVLKYIDRRLAGNLPAYRPKPDATLAGFFRRIVARADELAGKPFVNLTGPERKAVVERLAKGSKADVGYNVKGLPTPETAADPDLFALLRRNVLEGTFCDPRSGGNANYRAWERIGHVCHSNYPREHRCDPAKKQHR